jgi:hypothetical protein
VPKSKLNKTKVLQKKFFVFLLMFLVLEAVPDLPLGRLGRGLGPRAAGGPHGDLNICIF